MIQIGESIELLNAEADFQEREIEGSKARKARQTGKQIKTSNPKECVIEMENRKLCNYLNDYFLVDFAAKYQKGYRNNIVSIYQVPRLVKKFRAYDCFCTYFRYSPEIITHSKSNLRNGIPSVSGYEGRVHATYLPIDIDSQDLNQALEDTRDIGRYLRDVWGCPEDSFNIYFSGSHGFHLMVRDALFGEVEPSNDLHLVFSKLRKRIAEESGVGQGSIDYSIKDRVRLLRLPNTINAKSNLYKIQLALDEIFELTVDEIKAKAVKPGHLWNTDRTGLIPKGRSVEPNEYAVELYEKAAHEVKRIKSRFLPVDTEQPATPKNQSGKLFCKARQKVWYSTIPKGSRNNCCVRLVSELRLKGVTELQAEDMISFWNQNNEIGLPLEEIKGIVKTVYSSRRPYDFGCRDEIIRSFCPFEDRSKCAHYRSYKKLISVS